MNVENRKTLELKSDPFHRKIYKSVMKITLLFIIV